MENKYDDDDELVIIIIGTVQNDCTTTEEIERIIKSLKTKNSYGYDDIYTKILKISCPFISSPINYICNKMLFGVYSLID